MSREADFNGGEVLWIAEAEYLDDYEIMLILPLNAQILLRLSDHEKGPGEPGLLKGKRTAFYRTGVSLGQKLKSPLAGAYVSPGFSKYSQLTTV